MQLRLRNAESARRRLTREQKKAVKDLYKRAEEETHAALQVLLNKPNVSDLTIAYFMELESRLAGVYSELNNDLEQTILRSVYNMSEATYNSVKTYLDRIGMRYSNIAFGSATRDVVTSIVTGSVYKNTRVVKFETRAQNWGLSKSIWGGNQKVLKDIHSVIAQGVAQGKSVYQIAKGIERYVNPSVKKDFQWSKVYPGTNLVVDFNAQRLVRTLIDHAYQQSMKEYASHDPWINFIQWHSAFAHGRTCQECIDMDGNKYSSGSPESDEKYEPLPLDHPNGLCTQTYGFDKSLNQIVEDINKWIKQPYGTYPRIDDLARWLNAGG